MAETLKTAEGVEVYEDQITMYLDEYAIQKGMTLDDLDQSKWNAALMYVCRRYFKGHRELLMSKENAYTGNLLNGNPSSGYVYDFDKVMSVLSVYMAQCFDHSKEVSIVGFSNLTGINQDTFHDWGKDLSNPKCEIYKILSTGREESLSNKLVSGKVNPVGILGVLNRHYGWNMGQPRETARERAALPDEIRGRYLLQTDQTGGKPDPVELPDVDLSED